MAEVNNQDVKSPREQLLSRLSEHYPDRRFPGQTGQDGQDGQDDIEQAVLDLLTETDTEIGDWRSKNEKLVKIFVGDPTMGEFIQEWVESGDPRAALVSTFGDDLAELGTEEGRSHFSESLNSWRERKKANDALDEEAKANLENTFAALDEWGDKYGMDATKKAEVFLRLVSIAANGIVNKYSVEDFEMVRKEMNYDSDVASARESGLVAGRNERIAAARRERSAANAMPPTMTGGRSIAGREATPKEDDPWAGVV